jgi:hypothetical protein
MNDVKWYEAGTVRIGVKTSITEDNKYLHVKMYITEYYPWEEDCTKSENCLDTYEFNIPYSVQENKLADVLVSVIESLGYELVDYNCLPVCEPQFPMRIKRVSNRYRSVLSTEFTVNNWNEYRAKCFNQRALPKQARWDHKLKKWFMDSRRDYTDFVLDSK